MAIEIEFPLKNIKDYSLKIVTRQPEAVFGATYLVVAPQHSLVDPLKSYVQNWDEVTDYIDHSNNQEKAGVELKGIKAINPSSNEEISVWVADYVSNNDGASLAMAVPAHNEVDFEFAKKFHLPIQQVIAPETGIKRGDEQLRDGSCGVVFDPITQKYAVAKLEDGTFWLYAGGVEPGEEAEQAMLREVTEESGLYDFDRIEKVGVSYTHYYNILRQVNRVANVSCFLVVLKSAMTQDLKLEAHEKFEIAWVTADEIIQNWTNRNSEKNYDHWLWFMPIAVAKAIEFGYDSTSDPKVYKDVPYTDSGVLVNSGKFNGLNVNEAIPLMTEAFGKQSASL